MLEDKPNLKYWGEIKRERLPKEIDLHKLKQAKPTLVDEPLLPSMLNIDTAKLSNLASYQTRNGDKQSDAAAVDQKPAKISLQPSIDSYIINTIKLNQILKNQVPFDQVDFFFKKPAKKTISKKQAKIRVSNDEDARHYMKQFITIMSLHCGFVGRKNRITNH
jgi:hypothetical protein